MLIAAIVLYCVVTDDNHTHCRVWPGHSLDVKPYCIQQRGKPAIGKGCSLRIVTREPTWGPKH